MRYCYKRRCFCNRFPRRHVTFEGSRTGRRFYGCHYETPKCPYLLWKDPAHSGTLRRALVQTWKETSAELSDSSDNDAAEKEARDKAREDIAPILREIHDICINVSTSLEPLTLQLYGLTRGNIADQ